MAARRRGLTIRPSDMKAKDLIIIFSLVVIAVLCFWLGSMVGAQRERERQEAQFRITVDLSSYQIAAEGNVERLKGRMGILLLGSVRDYERRFGEPSGTNRFARDFATAQGLAQTIESQLVPVSSIATSVGSNVTIRVER